MILSSLIRMVTAMTWLGDGPEVRLAAAEDGFAHYGDEVVAAETHDGDLIFDVRGGRWEG